MTDDPDAFRLFTEIGIIAQLSGTLFARHLPKGMTPAQFTVLNHFVRLGHKSRSPAQLASAFQLTRPTMTSTLSRMRQNGLIEISADPADGRAKLVSLTQKGREMRQKCLAAIEPLLPLAATALSEEEIATMLPKLAKLRALLDKARD
jgi:DNA-binding MarR family transcriptional regulator